MATPDLAHLVRVEFQQVWERLLAAVEPLTEAQMAWHPSEAAPSIAFHLWHAARWTDYYAEGFREPGTQIWERERLAAAWGIAPGSGYEDTGMGMADDEAVRLAVPKAALLDYARRAFESARAVIEPMSAEQLLAAYEGHRADDWRRPRGDPSIAWLLLMQAVHLNRHLGMIEALKGAQGLRGTATQ